MTPITVTDYDRRDYPALRDDEILYIKTQRRINALKAMNLLARAANDEDCIFYWLQNGVADGDHTDEDMLSYAQDNDMFKDMCDTFLYLMRSKSMREGGFFFDMG